MQKATLLQLEHLEFLVDEWGRAVVAVTFILHFFSMRLGEPIMHEYQHGYKALTAWWNVYIYFHLFGMHEHFKLNSIVAYLTHRYIKIHDNGFIENRHNLRVVN